MEGARRTTTLADVRVGGSAVLLAGSALDTGQARRLVELGLRPGATVRVMMRTAGGGRVLGVENLRIVVDRDTLGSIPVAPGPSLPPSPGTADAVPDGRGEDRSARRRRSGARLGTAGRRLRLLGRPPSLTVLPVEPVGDGTDRG